MRTECKKFCVLAVQVMANSSDLISIHQFNIHRFGSFSMQVMHFIRMNKKEITTSLNRRRGKME